MSHHRTSSLPSRLIIIALAAPFILGLSACTEVNRFLARAESKPAKDAQAGPQVAEEAAPEPIPEPQEKPKRGKLYEWSGDGRRVSRIVVNTDEQKARFYDGDEQIGWTTVASGVTKFPTPTGHFEVMEKVANKRSNLYGKIYGAGGQVVRSDAKAGRDSVPAGARFEGAKMPYFLRLTNDGIGLHAGPIPRPGRPASHGCIRMPSKLAPVLYEHVNLGTKVSIVGSGPDYGNYVQKQRAIAAREKERREAAAREQAVAAAATPAGTPDQARPTATPVASAATPAGASVTSQADSRADAGAQPGAPAGARPPADAAPRAEPSVAGPATAGPTGNPMAQTETPSPAPEATAAVAPVTSPQPSPPVAPLVAAPAGAPPAPGYPAPVAPVAPPLYYPPPMWPAAATVPVLSPVPAQATSLPSNPPAATPAPVPAPAPAEVSPPPGVSTEQPRASAEASGG